MYPTAELCRSQQAHQLERARSSSLENVRTVAIKAATVWGVEAKIAEVREARRDRTRLIADGIKYGLRTEAMTLLSSEIPERGEFGR